MGSEIVAAIDAPSAETLKAASNRAGANAIHLYLLDPTGRPAAALESLTLELSLPSNQLGPIRRQPFTRMPEIRGTYSRAYREPSVLVK